MANQSNPLSRLLDKNILNGPNFPDWLRNLKLVLNMEKIAYCLDKSPPVALPDGSSEDERMSWMEWHEHDFRARTYLLASMNNDLQRQHENMRTAADMILNLKELYGEQSRTARYEISKRLFLVVMSEGMDNLQLDLIQ